MSWVDPLDKMPDSVRTILDEMFMRGEPVIERGGREYQFTFESDLDWTQRTNSWVTLWACEIDGVEYRFSGRAENQ
jgi:hypothetical protein